MKSEKRIYIDWQFSFCMILVILGILNINRVFEFSLINNIFYIISKVLLGISAFFIFVNPLKAVLILPLTSICIAEFQILNYRILYIDILYIFLLFYIFINRIKKSYLKIETPLFLKISSFILIVFVLTALQEYYRSFGNIKIYLILIKYIEYFTYPFIIYYFFKNAQDNQNMKCFFMFLLLAIYLIGFYGVISVKFYSRATAPFEQIGEPNTIGGMMLVFICIIFFYLLNFKNKIYQNIFLIFLLIQSIYVLFKTYSRTSYIAFSIMILVTAYYLKNNFVRFVLFIGIIILTVNKIPDDVIFRINTIYQGNNYYVFNLPIIGDLSFNTVSSAAARLNKYLFIINEVFPYIKFFGRGIEGIGFVDGFIFKIIGETGLIGLIFFIMTIRYIFYELNRKECMTKKVRCIVNVMIIGLLAHSLFVNTFIIYRIIFPFYCFILLIIFSEKIKEIII